MVSESEQQPTSGTSIVYSASSDGLHSNSCQLTETKILIIPHNDVPGTAFNLSRCLLLDAPFYTS